MRELNDSAAGDRWLFYAADSNASLRAPQIDPGYTIEYWTPTLAQAVPEGMPPLPFAIWSLFHFAGVFYNRGYALFLIRHNGRIVHRSVVTPGYFRFPFMRSADLQVGDTWTDPEHRGRGLATLALTGILHRHSTGRRIWYIVEGSNAASIRVVEKAGFTYAGAGCRMPRFGLSVFAAYRLIESV